jgi:OOP family OmpA-OmpF porin
MKKILLIPALLAGSLAFATDYNFELTPQVGYNFVGGSIPLQDYGILAAELQYNGFNFPIKPEASILYSIADYETIPGYNDYADTTMIRAAINGVYEFNTFDSFIPLVKAGVGYDNMDDPYEAVQRGIFLDAGAGVKIPFDDRFSLKLEALYIAKFNDVTYDGNLAILAGITIPFGEKVKDLPEEEKKSIAAPAAVAPVVVSKRTAAPIIPPVDLDDDNDGVTNSKDKCPNTSSNVKKVDADGCAVLVSMKIGFAFDSYKITKDNFNHIEDFVLYMKDRKTYNVKIIGHTDTVGPKNYNQKLSQKRAEATKALMVNKGIDSKRISTLGRGETAPIATNKTKDGRAQNRRIEVEIIK